MFRAVERAVLSTGMSLVAFVIERRLLRAIKKGGLNPAPRTAAQGDGSLSAESGNAPSGEVATGR